MQMKYLAAMLASTAVPTVLYAPVAQAQTDQRIYDIAPQRLSDALRKYSEVSGREVIHSGSLTEGKRSGRAQGRLTPDAALTRLLSGTGLIAEVVDDALVIREGNGDAELASSTEPASEAIIVTGSRIRGAAPVGSPLTTIDRDALDRSGRATLADFIQTIPQNFSGGPTEANVGFSNRGKAASNVAYGSSFNLRGLGPGATLTLYDGTRPALGGSSGAHADISLIPSIAIERLEMLTDGASAIYGSDAVAGVVNIRFRNRFDGAETRVRAATADGDFGELQAAQLFGTGWSSGHLVAAAEYSLRGRLAASKRRFATEDLRSYGGPDLRSNFASPGTIVDANGQKYLIPAGQDGRNLSASELVPSADYARGDARRLSDILPRQETLSLFANAEQGLGSSITFFARGHYSRRKFDARRRVDGPVPLVVTSSNPFYVDPIGSGAPITVYYDPSADFGPEGLTGRVEGINTHAGARLGLGRWTLEASGGFGLQRERYDGRNIVHPDRLAQALASTDPATAFNPFGDGAVNGAGLVDSLRGSLSTRTRYKSWTAALRADGPLFRLPAGDVKVALGGEYRRDQLRFIQTLDLIGDEPFSFGIPGLPDHRPVRAIYGEIIVPVFDAGDTFPGALSLSAAGRYEDYSDVGDRANPKVGIRWTPTPGLSLRASYGRSFRAPYFDELVGAANALYQTRRLADPASPSGQSVVLALFGYRPDLDPERAESWTVGAELEPALLPGLKLSATYFDIRYRDRISSASSDSRNILVRRSLYEAIIDDNPDPALIAAYFAGPNFSNSIGVQPGEVTAIVDLRTRNLSTSTIRGLDFDVAYSRDIAGGSVSLAMGGTRLFAIDNRITSEAPREKVVGTLGNPVKFRLNGRAGVVLGNFDGGIAVSHMAGYRNLTVIPEERVKGWTTFDLQFGTRIGDPDDRSLRLALSVTNLFDAPPPYARFQGPSYALAYDPEQASAIGRTISLQAIMKW